MEPLREERNAKIPERSYYTQILGLIGATMIFIPEHIANVWGTINVYVSSYVYVNHRTSKANSAWTISAVFTGAAVGMIFSGHLTCLGKKTKVFLSILVFNISVLSLSVISQHGLTSLFWVAFGILGVCTGITDATVIKLLSELAGSSKGTFMSIAFSAFNFGPLFINLLAGTYMNPSNLPTDIHVDGMSLFTKSEVIDKVPILFIILGAGYFVCMFTGYCLLFFSVSKTKKTPRQVNDTNGVYKSFSNHDCKDDIVQTTTATYQEDKNSRGQSHYTTAAQFSTPIIKVNYNSGYDENNKSESRSEKDSFSKEYELPHKTISEVEDQDKVIEADKETESLRPRNRSHSTTHFSSLTAGNENSNDSERDERDMSPLQAMKCPSFYVISFGLGSSLFPFLLVHNSFKTFGLIYIEDDRLLTVLGSSLSLVGGVTRIMWGFVLDRFSTRNCLVALFAYLSLTVLMMYFSVFVHEYVYFVATLLAGIGINTVFSSFVYATFVYFGETHFDKNYGILFAMRFLFSFVIPPVFDVLQDVYGWFGTFCCTACITILPLILVVIFVPDVSQKRKSTNS